MGSRECGIPVYPSTTAWQSTNPAVARFRDDTLTTLDATLVGVAPGDTVVYGMVSLLGGPLRRADLFFCTGEPSRWSGECRLVERIKVLP